MLPTYFKKDRSKKEEIYAEKLIKEVGLENKSNEKIKSLSGGQKQRTAIARALINKPKLIIADEPTGNLDSITSKKIISLLKNLWGRIGGLLCLSNLIVASVNDLFPRRGGGVLDAIEPNFKFLAPDPKANMRSNQHGV